MEPQDTPLQRGMMNLAFGPRKVFESLEAIASEDPSESGRDFHNHPENRKVSEFESKLESKSTRSMKTERERERMCAEVVVALVGACVGRFISLQLSFWESKQTNSEKLRENAIAFKISIIRSNCLYEEKCSY